MLNAAFVVLSIELNVTITQIALLSGYNVATGCWCNRVIFKFLSGFD